MQMTKTCAQWVPQMFDQKMKDCLRKASNENLKLMQLNWNLFIWRIVMTMKPGYITTILRPMTKQQTMQWKHASQFSKLSEVQAVGISRQYNLHCFLGC